MKSDFPLGISLPLSVLIITLWSTLRGWGVCPRVPLTALWAMSTCGTQVTHGPAPAAYSGLDQH